VLTLDQPLQYPHYGEIQQIAGRAVDERAEVGLLSRNITIQGAGTLIDGVPTAPDGIGGHIMILAGATAKVQGVELVNMGQRGQLGHYPIHWHLAGAVPGQYIRNSVIWRSNNRCVTVHGTRELSVEGNVCYDHLGHGYFLEEGAETGNRLFGNLGLLSRFVGMITDSRSFVSYPRHEYFRRTLCNLLGGDIARGEIPNDMALVGGMVKNICFANARGYFGLELAKEFSA
jgi:hypothetical protein